MDKICITILDDGSIKIVTDGISPANHTTADKMILDIIRTMGGETERTRLTHHHHNGHEHTHN